MEANTAKRAAELIAQARRSGQLLQALPDECRPTTLAEGYGIQHAFLELWDAPTAGWKCAATAEDVQAAYAITAPFYGRVFGPTVFQSPASVAAEAFGRLCIETEFAFRFGTALPPRDSAYEREEIVAAIDVLIPAFEIISPRFDSLLTDDVPTCAADCAINGGAVLGRPYENWDSLNLAEHEVRFLVNGEERGAGTGAKALGHPFNVLDWLVNALSRRGIDLNAGEIVSTGTCTGIVYIEKGQKAVADYGVLGAVEVTFD